MCVARLCSVLLMCVSAGSAAVKRRRTENESTMMPLVWDVIALVSRFLDCSDLFPFSRVCHLFEDVAAVSLSFRTQGMIKDNRCRNRLVHCKKRTDLIPKSAMYAAMDGQRTLIRFESEHLLIRGVGHRARPGYSGKVIVKRRVKVPISDEFKMTADKDWIWTEQGWLMNLHNNQSIQLDRKIFDFVPPFIVQIDEDTHPLLYHLDPQTMGITLKSHCKETDISVPYKDLYLLHSSLDRLPSLVILEDGESGCGFLDFNDEMEQYRTWPEPFNDDQSLYQMIDTHPKMLIVLSSEIDAFVVFNPANERSLVRSIIPSKKSLSGPSVNFDYICRENGKYALISLSEQLLMTDEIHQPPQIFDLQTGEMIGPETNGDDWVSEEVFHVPKQTQFTVRSVHQPRENIACVMVDEGGNETPMMDEHFRILHKDDVLFDVRSNEILFVEWERDH